jgi:tetratricopeptide (TPR) repeat protein
MKKSIMPRNSDNDMEFPDMRSINPGDMLNSLFELLGFENHQAEEAVRNFFTAWSEEEYDKAYGYLASDSPLREGLSRKAWIERRRSWVKGSQAKNLIFDVAMPPSDGEEDDEDEELEVIVADDVEGGKAQPRIIEVKTALSIAKLEDEEDEDDEEDEEDLGPKEVEVFWTLEIPGEGSGKRPLEIPTPTLTLKESGDNWFWTSYTVVKEGEKWLIQDVHDKGEEALALSVEEVKELQNELIARIGELAEEVEEEIGDEDLDENDEEDEDEEFDEDEDEDEDDEEFGDLEFAELAGRVQETMWLTLRTLAYGDVLYNKLPGDLEVYEGVYNQASQFQQFDRAAAYAQLQAERVPAQRADALRDYAVATMNLSDLLTSDDTLEEEDKQEIVEQYASRAEQALTVSIATDDAPHAHILFANILIKQNTRLEEAEAHLEKLKSRDLDDLDRTYISIGEANIARLRNEPEKALACYQEAATLSPDIPHIWFNIGHFQRELGDLDTAQASLARSIEDDAQEVEAYTELAAIYSQLGRLPEAQELLEDGLELNPDSVDLLAALSLVHTTKGDLKAAEEFLDEAEEIDEEHYLVEQARQQFDAAKSRQRQQKGKLQGKNKPGQQNNNKKKK